MCVKSTRFTQATIILYNPQYANQGPNWEKYRMSTAVVWLLEEVCGMVSKKESRESKSFLNELEQETRALNPPPKHTHPHTHWQAVMSNIKLSWLHFPVSKSGKAGALDVQHFCQQKRKWCCSSNEEGVCSTVCSRQAGIRWSYMKYWEHSGCHISKIYHWAGNKSLKGTGKKVQRWKHHCPLAQILHACQKTWGGYHTALIFVLQNLRRSWKQQHSSLEDFLAPSLHEETPPQSFPSMQSRQGASNAGKSIYPVGFQGKQKQPKSFFHSEAWFVLLQSSV